MNCPNACRICDQFGYDRCPQAGVTKGETMAAVYLSESYARGGYVESVIIQLLADIQKLKGETL